MEAARFFAQDWDVQEEKIPESKRWRGFGITQYVQPPGWKRKMETTGALGLLPSVVSLVFVFRTNFRGHFKNSIFS